MTQSFRSKAAFGYDGWVPWQRVDRIVMKKENVLSIDQEWVSLMEVARTLGLTAEEVRTFLSEFKRK